MKEYIMIQGITVEIESLAQDVDLLGPIYKWHILAKFEEVHHTFPLPLYKDIPLTYETKEGTFLVWVASLYDIAIFNDVISLEFGSLKRWELFIP